MIQAWLLRIHRWTTLVFAVPIAIVVITGLILAAEPLWQQAKPDQPVTLELVQKHLAQHDKAGKATGLSIRTYENSLRINGVGDDGEIDVDLATGEELDEPGAFAASTLFSSSRRLHETLNMDLGWLVNASTWAMLVLATLGFLMGWPRIRNTLSGWHKATGWGLAPLMVISPLTGLAIAYGVTFIAPAPRAPAEKVSIRDAVALVAKDHDLANLTSLRTRGGQLVARIYVNGTLTGFAVKPAGLEPAATNLPRLIHEGNWGGAIGPVLNILVAIGMIGLMITGLTIWARRKFRRLMESIVPLPEPGALRV
jgi:uncharacterized iron-regulated membrane protein